VSYDDAVCEALAFGWVDSTAGTLDDDRSRMYFAPRRRWERLGAVEQAASGGAGARTGR
jgi:hypothetical protein